MENLEYLDHVSRFSVFSSFSLFFRFSVFSMFFWFSILGILGFHVTNLGFLGFPFKAGTVQSWTFFMRTFWNALSFFFKKGSWQIRFRFMTYHLFLLADRKPHGLAHIGLVYVWSRHLCQLGHGPLGVQLHISLWAPLKKSFIPLRIPALISCVTTCDGIFGYSEG